MSLPKYFTQESLTEAVKTSTSMIQTIKKLYPRYSAGIIPTIRKYVKLWNIDTSHWKGQGWSRGKINRNRWTRPEDVFVENGSHPRGSVKTAFLRLAPYRCSVCGIDSWCGNKITLQLDHINGVNSDNRFDNLRLLCPNCHSQTATFSGRNRNS